MARKVLVTSRSFGEAGPGPARMLQENGFAVVRTEKQSLLTEGEFRELLPEYDALIIGADPLTARVLDAAPRLRIVCKHGTGLDNIDLAAAKARGVTVTNVPAVNADAVADVTLALMLDVSRRITYAASRVKDGHWDKCIGRDVCGKRLGIVGLGKIGRKVAQRAAGFGMRVSGFDPLVERLPPELGFIRLAPLDELIAESDILTLHVPLSDATRNLLAAPQLERMKEGAILINTARGGIVNEDDLCRSLKSGHLGGAGLDVTVAEPPAGSPLLGFDNVVILPHMASYSKESLNEISLICARNIIDRFGGRPLRHVVVA